MSDSDDSWNENGYDDYEFIKFERSPHIRFLKIIHEPSEIDAEIQQLYKRCKDFPVVGLDCEWNPTRMKKEQPQVALLQLATRDGYCVLIRTCFLDHLPTSLLTFLNDSSILKTGVGIHYDGEVLKMKYDACKVRGRFDVRFLSRRCNIYSKNETLKELAKSLLSFELDKNNTLYYTWHSHELGEEKAEYAALDALAGVKIFEKLLPLYHELFCTDTELDETIMPQIIKKYFTHCPNMCSKVIDKKFK